MIGIMVIISGCARWPDEPGPEPGETEYQLKITVEVAGNINSGLDNDGIYYIVFDADSDSTDGPSDDLNFWEDDYYYIMLDGTGFYFAQVKDGFESYFSGGSITGTNKFQITIAISDLGDPVPTSIGINVVTTDLDGYTYDSLNDYFSIRTELNQTGEGFSSTGLKEEEADFDIVEAKAVITTLY